MGKLRRCRPAISTVGPQKRHRGQGWKRRSGNTGRDLPGPHLHITKDTGPCPRGLMLPDGQMRKGDTTVRGCAPLRSRVANTHLPVRLSDFLIFWVEAVRLLGPVADPSGPRGRI